MADAVAFVDSRVANPSALVDALRSRAEIVFLRQEEDGLLQIDSWLEVHPGIDAVHVISHGAEASLVVGSGEISLANLSTYTQVLSRIGAALKPGADIPPDGCDVAAGADGHAFVQQLA